MDQIGRRTLLTLGAALAGAGILGASPVRAVGSPIVDLGSKTITTLSDGNLVLPLKFVYPQVPPADLEAILAAHNLPKDRLEPECNITVLRDGQRLVVFDVGAGAHFMPTAGKLPDNLEAANIDPADVTDVVFTHAHPDHLWGLLDDFDELGFPNATYHMGRSEWEYWRADDTMSKTPDFRKSFVVGAQNRTDILKDRIQLFEFGAEVLPGVEAVDTRGHTPGHASFTIYDGTQSLMVVGDAITSQVSFSRPQWRSGSDQDAMAGIKTRENLLDRLATDETQICAFHLPNGGIGRVERHNGHYRFTAQ